MSTEQDTDAQQDAERDLQLLLDGIALMGRQEYATHRTRGTLLGLALSIIDRGLREGWYRDVDTTAAALNDGLAQCGSPWRLVRPS
jgi:hypothetical protein